MAGEFVAQLRANRPIPDPRKLCERPHECRCGGQQHQVAKLHDDLAAYLWRVQGTAALGIVSAHYARGGDAGGFAAGVPRNWRKLVSNTVHTVGMQSA